MTTTDDAYGNLRVQRGEIGVELGEQLGRCERRRGDDDAVCRDRLTVREHDLEAGGRAASRRSRRAPVTTRVRSKPARERA